MGHETNDGWMKDRLARNPLAHESPFGERTAELDRRRCQTSGPKFKASDIRRLLEARRARASFFGADLFADPAWDILLFTFAAHLDQQRVSIGAVCDAAAVPSTTALRWINKLEQDGLVTRSDDPLDRRRAWVELTVSAVEAMERYLETVLRAALPA